MRNRCFMQLTSEPDRLFREPLINDCLDPNESKQPVFVASELTRSGLHCIYRTKSVPYSTGTEQVALTQTELISVSLDFVLI